MENHKEFLRKPPFRCSDCLERSLVVDVKNQQNYYICHKSPVPGVVYAWYCCNDVKDCPLGKKNLRIIY